jgi:prolipoprotein diacylglyceryltransferase
VLKVWLREERNIMRTENGHMIILAAQHAVTLQIGPIAVRWYPLAYLTGILAGWRLLQKMLKRPYPPLTTEHVGDLVVWILVASFWADALDTF